MRIASSFGTASANAWESSRTTLHETVLAVLLRENVFLRSGEETEPFRGGSGGPCRPVEAVKQAAADLVFLQHGPDRLALVDCGFPCSATVGVRRERLLEFVGESDVIDDEAARLVHEYPVDPGDGLHQPVAAHRLVHIHRVQARRIEAGKPHVAHQHHAQRIASGAKPFGQRLPAGFVADMRLPVRRVGGASGHHHLEAALVVVLAIPLGTQAHEFPVEVDADATAHADDHRLPVHGLKAGFVMVDDVLGDESQAFFRADDGFELRPFGLEFLLAFDLFAFGYFLEVGVDAGFLAFVERQFGETAFVMDRHGRLILDRALDVVDADVVSEHGAGAGVLQFDWACR